MIEATWSIDIVTILICKWKNLIAYFYVRNFCSEVYNVSIPVGTQRTASQSYKAMYGRGAFSAFKFARTIAFVA